MLLDPRVRREYNGFYALVVCFTLVELGGGEVEPGIYVTVLEELARHDASVAWNLFVANSAALIAPYMDEGAAAKVFSTPRTVVAWGPPHEGLAAAAARAHQGRWVFLWYALGGI